MVFAINNQFSISQHGTGDDPLMSVMTTSHYVNNKTVYFRKLAAFYVQVIGAK